MKPAGLTSICIQVLALLASLCTNAATDDRRNAELAELVSWVQRHVLLKPEEQILESPWHKSWKAIATDGSDCPIDISIRRHETEKGSTFELSLGLTTNAIVTPSAQTLSQVLGSPSVSIPSIQWSMDADCNIFGNRRRVITVYEASPAQIRFRILSLERRYHLGNQARYLMMDVELHAGPEGLFSGIVLRNAYWSGMHITCKVL